MRRADGDGRKLHPHLHYHLDMEKSWLPAYPGKELRLTNAVHTAKEYCKSVSIRVTRRMLLRSSLPRCSESSQRTAREGSRPLSEGVLQYHFSS